MNVFNTIKSWYFDSLIQVYFPLCSNSRLVKPPIRFSNFIPQLRKTNLIMNFWKNHNTDFDNLNEPFWVSVLVTIDHEHKPKMAHFRDFAKNHYRHRTRRIEGILVCKFTELTRTNSNFRTCPPELPNVGTSLSDCHKVQ